MNENQPNFESLRRLLALKRHETPPPGYFNNFSSQIMARIHAGEAEESASLSERLLAGMPWLVKWLQGLETKPVFASGFAAVLCMMLVFGAVVAQRPDAVPQTLLQPTTHEATPFATMTTETPAAPTALAQPANNQMMIAENSTNPVINFASVPLGQMPSPMASPQFVSYPVSDGN
jgi:hypothetical protein